MGGKEFNGGEKVIHQLGRVDFALQFAAFVIIAGIAAN